MGWVRRLRSTIWGSHVTDEFDEESRFHRDQRIAEYIEGGMSPEEAARQAASAGVRRLRKKEHA